MPPLSLNQYELTYINLIPVYPEEKNPSARIFKFWQPVKSLSLSEPDDVSFNIAHVFRDEADAPFARLTANAFRGQTTKQGQIVQFGLTTRGFRGSRKLSDASEFFDFARDKIVRGFKDLTTDEMHLLWRITPDV
jgi:hypothetical protein